MSRRLALPIGLLAGLALAVAACGSTPAEPELTDPTAIVTAAVKAADASTSVHVDASVDGAAPISLPGIGGALGGALGGSGSGGGGGSAAPIDLTGTTASADIDMAAPAAHATFTIPTVFNVTGDLIVTGGQAYAKTTMTGAKYQRVALSSLPVDVTDVHGLIDQLGDAVLGSGVPLAKGSDVACGSASCYTVTANLTADQLTALLGGAPSGLPVDLAGSTLEVTIRVEKSAPHHLAGATITSTAASGDKLTADLRFSAWDEPVTVAAPPADQVAGG